MNPTTPESPLLRRLGAMRTVAPLAKAGPFLFQACEPRIAISRGYGLAWVMLDDEQYRNAATMMLLKEYPKRQAVHLPVETVVVMDRTTRQRGFVYVDLTEREKT